MNGMAGMRGLRLPAQKVGRSHTRLIVPTMCIIAAHKGVRRPAVRRPVPHDPHGTEEEHAVMPSQSAGPLSPGPLVRSFTRIALLGRLADTFKHPRAAGPSAIEESPSRTCVAFDIVGFGARCYDDEVQVFVHQSLYHILELAFGRSGVGWEASRREDRGDGALIIVPEGTPPAMLIGPLVAELAVCLRRYNKLVADAAQIRLRMAVHTGPVYSDANGQVGSCLVHLFRMLEAPAFKHAVAASAADLGVVTSERLYRDVIEPSPSAMDLGTYEPIEVDLKETHSSAWVYVPDQQRRSALREMPLPA